MTSKELKTILIHRISEINDISFLKELNIILKNSIDQKEIQLSQEQIDEIAASARDIRNGLFIENTTLEKEVNLWLKGR